jgi:hypothetical protein
MGAALLAIQSGGENLKPFAAQGAARRKAGG